MRVSIYQAEGRPGDVAANLAALGDACARAAASGSALLVLPELWLTGFWLGERVRALALAADDAALARVRDLAGEHRVALCVGYPERDGDVVYNSALLVDADGGVLGNYRKHRLSGAYENASFARGDGADLVVDVGGLRAGVLICYDAEFPENVRRLARAGIDLLLVPTALSAEFAFVGEKMMPTRAFENGIFVAYADRCGAENGKRYAGASCIAAPDGTDLARAGAGEALIGADVAPARYAALADRLPYLRDLDR